MPKGDLQASGWSVEKSEKRRNKGFEVVKKNKSIPAHWGKTDNDDFNDFKSAGKKMGNPNAKLGFKRGYQLCLEKHRFTYHFTECEKNYEEASQIAKQATPPDVWGSASTESWQSANEVGSARSPVHETAAQEEWSPIDTDERSSIHETSDTEYPEEWSPGRREHAREQKQEAIYDYNNFWG